MTPRATGTVPHIGVSVVLASDGSRYEGDWHQLRHPGEAVLQHAFASASRDTCCDAGSVKEIRRRSRTWWNFKSQLATPMTIRHDYRSQMIYSHDCSRDINMIIKLTFETFRQAPIVEAMYTMTLVLTFECTVTVPCSHLASPLHVLLE